MSMLPETGKRGETAPAPCTNYPTALFFPKTDSSRLDRPSKDERAALNVCAACPLASRRRCLTEALQFPAYKQFGIVGGATAAQRKAILWLRNNTVAEVA